MFDFFQAIFAKITSFVVGVVMATGLVPPPTAQPLATSTEQVVQQVIQEESATSSETISNAGELEEEIKDTEDDARLKTEVERLRAERDKAEAARAKAETDAARAKAEQLQSLNETANKLSEDLKAMTTQEGETVVDAPKKPKSLLDIEPGSPQDTWDAVIAREKVKEIAEFEERRGEIKQRINEILDRYDEITLEKVNMKETLAKKLGGYVHPVTVSKELDKLDKERILLDVEKGKLERELTDVESSIYSLKKEVEELQEKYAND